MGRLSLTTININILTDTRNIILNPNTVFEYSVADTHTRDIQSQHMALDGDHVTASYTLHQPDDSVRTVHYNADGHSGFNEQVE